MAMPHSSKQQKKGRDGDTVEWYQKPAVQQKTKERPFIEYSRLQLAEYGSGVKSFVHIAASE